MFVLGHEKVYAVVGLLERMRDCARTLFVGEVLERLTIHLDHCLTFSKFAAPACRTIRLKEEQQNGSDWLTCISEYELSLK